MYARTNPRALPQYEVKSAFERFDVDLYTLTSDAWRSDRIVHFPSRLKPYSTILKSRTNDLTDLPRTYRAGSSYRGSFSAPRGSVESGLKAKRIAVDTPLYVHE